MEQFSIPEEVYCRTNLFLVTFGIQYQGKLP